MEIEAPIYVDKVWGSEVWMANTDLYCGKLLHLKKGKRCSIHYHKNKDETFYLYSGRILMELWKDNKFEERIMGKGEALRINPNTKHRFSGLEDSLIIEISTHHEEEDSYRDSGQLSGDIPKEVMERYS